MTLSRPAGPAGIAARLRDPSAAAPSPRARTTSAVLFRTAVALLVAVHAVIFGAVLVLAPVTPAEQRALDLLQLPVDAARLLALPFHALLLVSLFTLGRRIAGRWAGFGAMLALLALDLAADPARPVFGPPTAVGGWAAAALLAAALVALPRRPRTAALLLGAASGGSAILVLALPAFLIAIGVAGPRHGRRRAGELGAFAGVWAAAAVIPQLVWLARLGAAGWLARAEEYLAEFAPHPVVPLLEQQRLLFSAWHFAPLVTVALALFLFAAAGTGLVRYFAVPLPGERGAAVARVLRRLPVELWAASLVLVGLGTWWALSGSTVIVDPNVPALAAIAPLLTPMAYRGSKWLLTVNRFWAVCAIVYLTGLVTVRSTQLAITLVQAFTR